MGEVCHCVGIEPGLQPLTQEQFEHRTANREDGARLDIVAQSYSGPEGQSSGQASYMFSVLRVKSQ